MTTTSFSFSNLSITAITITASLSLVQALASAQEIASDHTPAYTEASYLIDAAEPTSNNASSGGPCIGVLPEGNIQTRDETAKGIQVKPDEYILAPHLFNRLPDPSQTVPQQSFTLFEYQF